MTPLEMATTKPPKPESGIKHFGGELGRALSDFEAWLNSMFDRFDPAGVLFESPILPQTTTPATVRKLMSMAGILLMVCARRGIRWVREEQPGRVKKYICGNGGKGKEGVMGAIRSFGWAFSNDDEADALSLFCFAGDLYAAERRRAGHEIP